jgi:hypothetical protein
VLCYHGLPIIFMTLTLLNIQLKILPTLALISSLIFLTLASMNIGLKVISNCSADIPNSSVNEY